MLTEWVFFVVVCFDLFDENQNNEIDQEELNDMILQTYHMGVSVILALSQQGQSALIQSIIRKHCEECAADWARMIFAEMDSDGNGVISREEFAAYIHSLKDQGESEETSVPLMIFASCFSNVQDHVSKVFQTYSSGLPNLLNSEGNTTTQQRRLEFLKFYFYKSQFSHGG